MKELLQLKSLTILNCKKVQSFSDISFLRNLIRIEIRGVKNLHDINFLANSKNIEVVIIETDKLASIKSLAGLKRIKALALFGKKFLNRRYGFDTDIQFRAAFNVGYPEPKMLPSKNKLLLELG